MFFIATLTFVGTSSVSRGGVAELGSSALRVLMVLPTLCSSGSLGWSEFEVAGGVVCLLVCAVVAICHQVGRVTTVCSERHRRRVGRTRAQ